MRICRSFWFSSIISCTVSVHSCFVFVYFWVESLIIFVSNGHEQKFSSLSQTGFAVQRNPGMSYEGGDADV